MESQNKLEAYYQLVKDYQDSLRLYREGVMMEQPTIPSSNADEDFPPPVSFNPNHWQKYSVVVRLNQKKREAEARLKRCVEAAEYLVKLVQRNSPSITSKEQWRTLVYPYVHCQNQAKIGFDGLQHPTTAQAFAADLGKQVFDFTGGEFFACYVEVTDQSSGGHTEGVRFYFVK